MLCGVGRFVEFTEHAHALVALRRLNNCAATAKKRNFGKRLMIDFALDDARIVRQRRIKQVRVERAKQRRAEAAKEEQASEEPGDGKRLGRGALQRLKKRQHPDADEDEAGKSAKKAKGKGGEESMSKAKVKWGTAEHSEGNSVKDLSKPYRERGNKMDGVVRPGAGRRAPAPADPRGVKAAAEAGGGNKNKGKNKAGAAAAKAKTAAQLNDQHLASLVAEVGHVMPKTKKSKKNKDKEDGLDKLVKQYTSTLFKSGQNEGRWFD
jgi:nucleolar protein 4